MTKSTEPHPDDELPEGPRFWYLIHTKPRQEEVALQNLERQGFTCYLPKITLHKVRRRKLQAVTEPMFPRYLFIHLGSDLKGASWSPIRSTLGVSRMVQFGQAPARVSDGLIQILRQREAAPPVTQPMKPGDRVVVTSGSLAGIEAAFQMTDGEGRVMVLLEILGRMLTVEVEEVIPKDS